MKTKKAHSGALFLFCSTRLKCRIYDIDQFPGFIDQLPLDINHFLRLIVHFLTFINHFPRLIVIS